MGGALGKGWGDGRYGAGVGLYYDHSASRFGGDEGRLDVSVGLATHLAEQVTLAVAADHLVPYADRKDALELGGGLHWALPYGAELAGDLRAGLGPESDAVLSGGLGMVVRVAEVVPVRAGFEWDGLEGEERVWAGIGLRTDTAQLDYGLGVSLQQPDRRVWNGLSLRVRL